MSVFDLTKTVESLRSHRAKDRNDALALLSGLPSAKLVLNSKQFSVLVAGLLHTLEIEQDAYAKSSTAANIARASNASGVLKSLIQDDLKRAIDKRLTFKLAVSIIETIKSLYHLHGSSRTFSPCVADFTKTLDSLLRATFVFSHLSHDQWMRYFKFLVGAITEELDQSTVSSINEIQLSDLLEMLYCILGGSSTSCVTPLLYNKAYMPLLSILRRSLSHFNKRESPSLVTAFRIINKLLLIIDTEDFLVSHLLIALGFDTLLLFCQTPVSALSEQLFLFLNLDPVHRFLSISKLPKLTSSSTRNSAHDSGELKGKDEDRLLYEAEMVIQALLQRMQSSNSRLSKDSFGICSELVQGDWFHLHNIYLGSDERLSWLLASGTAKLISTYFSLAASISESFASNSQVPRIDDSRISFKRQKISNNEHAMNYYRDALQFYSSMISASSVKTQIIGFQLLIFQHEQSSIPYDGGNDDSLPNITSEETTVVDLQSSTTGAVNFRLAKLLGLIAKAMSVSSTSFWALLTCRSVLTHITAKEITITSNLISRLKQILKIVVNLVRDTSLQSLACVVFEKIIIDLLPSERALVDEGLLSSLESIADLSDLSGPAILDNNSIKFWQAVSLVFSTLGSSRRRILPSRVADWFSEKWKDVNFSPKLSLSNLSPSVLASLIIHPSCLSKYDERPANSSSLADGMFSTMRNCEKFKGFQILQSEQVFEATCSSKTEYPTLHFQPDTVTKLVSTMCFSAVPNTAEEATILAIFFMELSYVFKERSERDSITLGDKARELASEVASLIKSKEQVTSVLLAILNSRITSEVFQDLEFPCEVIDYHYQYLPKLKEKVSESVFDSQFSASNGTYVSLRHQGRPDEDSTSVVSYFQFLVEYRNISISEIVSYLQNVNVDLALNCLKLYANSEKFNSHKSTPSIMIPILRLLGEKVLSCSSYDRTDSTVSSVCGILENLLPTLGSASKDFKNDYTDLASYLVLGVQKDIFLGQDAIFESWKFCFKFITYNYDDAIENSEIISSFISHFAMLSNCMKISLSSCLNDYLAGQSMSNQSSFLREIVERFEFPQQTVESSASFCYLLASLTKNLHLTNFLISNLIKYSQFEYFVSYIERSIDMIILEKGTNGVKSIFGAIRNELLKSWWLDKNNFCKFPFLLFGYSSRNDFFAENYRQIISLSISIDSSHTTEESKLALLNSLVEATSVDIHVLLSDSLPVIIPMAYTQRGIRNDVFASLMTFFGVAYTGVIEERLVLVILEIIRMTDVSNEVTLRAAVKGINSHNFFESGEVLPGLNECTVSPSSSKDLITVLISKFWRDNCGKFWSRKNSYFLLRQVGIDLKEKNSFIAKCALRKFQYILCLSGMAMEDFQNIRLIVESCIPFMEGELSRDVAPILNHIDFSNCVSVELEMSLPLLLNFICSAVLSKTRITDERCVYWSNLNSLITRESEYFGTSRVILEASIAMILQNPFYVEIDEIEKFLDDSRFVKLIQKSIKHILLIISSIFDNVRRDSKIQPKLQLVSIFLKHKSNDVENKNFRLWIAEYLASYYLSGHTSMWNISNDPEFSLEDTDNFEERFHTLNPVLEILVEELEKGDCESSALLECIFGVLISKFENNKREVSKFVDFDWFYLRFSTHLISLDLYSCSLLYSNIFAIGDVSLVSIVEGLATIMVKLPFHEWVNQLIHALLKEISKYTSLSPILAACVNRIPSISVQMLPRLLCFYILLDAKGALYHIPKFFSSFWASFKSPYDQESIHLIKSVALMIRVGALRKVKAFMELYDSLDKHQIFFILKESRSQKSALVLFEDSIEGKMEEMKWQEYREPLSELFKSLDDNDSLAGIPLDVSLGASAKMMNGLIPTSHRLKFTSGALDASFQLNESISASNMIDSLLQDGMLGVSKLLNDQSEHQRSSEWSWKLNQWDTSQNNDFSGKHNAVYSYFKKLRDNPSDSKSIYESSMINILSTRKSLDYTSVSKSWNLEMHEWLETFAVIHGSNMIIKSNPIQFASDITEFDIHTSWFKNVEPNFYEDILRARALSFDIYGEFFLNSKHDDSMIKFSNDLDLCRQAEVKEILRYCALLLNDHERQKLINSSILLEKLVDSIDMEKFTDLEQLKRLSAFQTAQTLWKEGHTSTSVSILSELEQNGDIDLSMSSLNVSSSLMRAYLATWKAESRLELGPSILSRLIKPMCDEIILVEDLDQRCRIYRLLGQFCERQLKSQSLKEQIEDLNRRVHSRKQEIEEIKAHYTRSSVPAVERKAVQKYYNGLKNQASSENLELENLKKLKANYAFNAVTFYLKSIAIGNETDEVTDKFVSLFLEMSGDENLQISANKELLSLPTHKLLPWCAQIISRISNETSPFQNTIQRLVLQLCRDHPYHSLYLLISLILHEGLARETTNISMLTRIEAAKSIQNKLRHCDIHEANIIQDVEKFCRECINLAELKCSKGRALQLDKLHLGEYWMHHLPSIPPPTLDLPVSRCGYQKAPTMTKVIPKVSIATSGLSLPKILTIELSNGKTHKMLLKHGADDLRQDAIMEQVFEKVNKMFTKDRETRKRKLRVRTYRAIPLGPKAGVIEFVPDSKALIEVIKPYHQQYDRMKLEKARDLMKNCQTGGFKERLKVFKDIEDKIQPVLSHFFLEKFVTPDSWFESRQVYVRGVATSSFVGYVLGLGDRHCNNILIDEFTGEPVHIDLGVAFDQGRLLQIPETVPFRLTRDIVDGFGFMGTTGAFSKLSEHTFRVLREHCDHILAILDVLRWDPLYSWSISPIKKKKLQGEVVEMADAKVKQDGSQAAKAILGVTEKLSSGGLSVEATVRELIREATNEQNLAVIYCGWCPFF